MRSQKFIQSTFPDWNAVANYEFAELGRIWVVWTPSVVVTVLHKSSQMITCLVKLPHVETSFVVSFVYAVNCRIGRRALWSDLAQLSSNSTISDQPWMILGDFNQPLNPEDSSTGGTRISGGMEEFRDCMYSSHLADLSFCGHHYTWWNKQEANPIARKLDRLLVNDNWLADFPLSYGEFQDPAFSDHCPTCVHLGGQLVRKQRPFKFSNFLLDNEHFLELVADFWSSTYVAGTSMFIVSKKLKLLKGKIRNFSRENYSGIEKRVSEAASALSQCQQNFLANPSASLAALEKEAHGQWMKLALAEEKFFCQRSRIQWLINGDSNTAFYFKMVAARRSYNQIHFLIGYDDRRIEEKEDIENHCVEFFQNLLGKESPPLAASGHDLISSLIPFRCSTEMRNMLTAEVSAAEIKDTVFALSVHKAPGPDGYNAEFLKATWAVTGPEIIRAVQEFFRNGQMLKQWNCTAITLIPKKVNADRLSDFRPISLCNVLYKIISKIIAKRLESILPAMISPHQSAFVKGRLLIENVLLATEMVQKFNQSNVSSRGVLKVDLRKAFDSLRWDFILRVLEAAHFPRIFIIWIQQCIQLPVSRSM